MLSAADPRQSVPVGRRQVRLGPALEPPAQARRAGLNDARPATKQLTESTLPAAEATLRDLRATSKALRDVTEKIDEKGAGSLLSSQPLPDYKP